MDIKKFFNAAIKFGASDMFVNSGKVPSFRVNGIISRANNVPPVETADLEAFRNECLTPAAREKYELSGSYDCSFAIDNRRFRINFLESVNGPGLVARLIREGSSCTFESLHLPADTMKKISALQRGMVIITGTTGSGKSSTMSAIINCINQTMDKHILTLEDPIEFTHEDKMSLISQRDLSNTAGGFIEAMRYAMRENPDVIVIGEIRDAETVNAAISAALTGHLVISTMHTSDASSAVERMLELFPEQQREVTAGSIAVVLEAVIAQRLVPVVNGDSMIPALDILIGTASVKRQISEQNFTELEQLMRAGSNFGMKTFNSSLIELFRNGIITWETALESTDSPDELHMMKRGLSQSANSSVKPDGTLTKTISEIDMKDLFKSAIRTEASDLLITTGVPPQLRINGQFSSLDLPPLSGADTQRLVYSLLTRRQRVALEEKRNIDFAISVKIDASINKRFRINAFFQRGTVALVGRLIQEVIPSPQELGIPPVLSALMRKKQGLILVTGPTGSGKSTTLASLLDQVNQLESRHIVTIEDPIEYVYNHNRAIIEQREIGIDALSFHEGIRSALRQAPDIIMVGELRDLETISAAISAAETGHLVLGTLHANNTCQTVERIIDSFPANQQAQIRNQFAGCILAVAAQRLIPRQDLPGKRVAAFEVMVGTMPVKALIRDSKTHQLASVIESSAKDGMITMARCMENYANSGIISQSDRFTFDSGT
ncbi:MAG: PilT/PilU family type 4a pilus ATPase [Lentisphaerae bacterium]|nr:PilT/PilU family type 4a pilus ATPase [Lentisphaerota bacterium]